MVKKKKIHLVSLYILFASLSLLIFFFSTKNVLSKAFEIDNIEISKPFEINFNKNDVINEGFKKAFSELILKIVNSNDHKKIDKIKVNEIKGMVESFTIKEEKFINEIYNVNLGVTFNKKKIFNYLEKKNIFPSIPSERKILFIPIIIDEKEKELLIFSNNIFFNNWTKFSENYYLIEYILPTEDLEDINLIKKRFDTIEEYDFEEIINKYNLDDSVVALIFKKDQELRILSKINIKNKVILKNKTFKNLNINNEIDIENVISELKNSYEDYWKDLNKINTSIKLSLNIRVDNSNSAKVTKFEKNLKETDLIYKFDISRFDKNYTFYHIVFNGTPNNFLKTMVNFGYNFNIQNKIWILK